ncbi:MAG: multidrug effflux MFS transporter [Pseudomonadota bacterium]
MTSGHVPSFLRSVLVLGPITALGPLTIDMYLPALPFIAGDLNTSMAGVQMTLTTYFLGFGAGQLIYGPWADQAGRKFPLYVGLLIFALSTVVCAFAPTADVLIIARFFQGLGGAVLMVIPRAIIRDLYTGLAAARLMGFILMVISVSPMLAPLIGTGLMQLGSWRIIFALLVIGAIIALVLLRFAYPETLAIHDRVAFHLRRFRDDAAVLLRDGAFMGLTFIGAFGMGSFFIFIASASFVYTVQFGLSSLQFSLAFACNGFGFFIATQLIAPIGKLIGMGRAVRVAVTLYACITLALLGLSLSGLITLPLLIVLLSCMSGCLGIVIPTTMVLALEDHGERAGLASSLGGTLQMVTGGIMIALLGPFFDGTVLPMVAAIAFCGVMGFTLMVLTGRAASRPLANKG